MNSNNNPETELTLDEISKLSESITNTFHINITGGEPFLRKDVFEIVKTFYNKSSIKSFGITTNGSESEYIFTTVKKILDLGDDINLRLSVSIDNISEKHDIARSHPGLYNKAVKTFDLIKTIDNDRLVNSINLTLTPENEGEIINIYRTLQEKLSPDMIDPILTRDFPRKKAVANISLDSYINLIDQWEKDIISHRFRSFNGKIFDSIVLSRNILSKRYTIDYLESGNCVQPCKAGIITGVIHADGSISPCEIREELFGNLRQNDYDLLKIWNSEPASSFRNSLSNKKCACTHECFINTGIVSNPINYPELLKKVFSYLLFKD